MTNKINEIDKITLLNGRNIKQCRQDSKRYKKKNATSLALSLDIILAKNGVHSSWREFIVRAKSLFSILPNGQKEDINISSQTLFLSSTCSNMDNVIMNQWLKSLQNNEESCDIVIDLTGDILKYATIASALNKNCPERGFRILNMTSENEKHQLSYTNTFKCDKTESQLLLDASKHTSKAILEPDIIDKVSSQEKIEVLREPQRYNLLSLLEREPGEGFEIREMFSPYSTTVVLLPSLVKDSKTVDNTFFDLLELIKKEQENFCNEFRITLTGISSKTDIPSHLVEWLFNSESVQTIAHSYYPSENQNNWTNKAIELSAQSFLSFAESHFDIPDKVKPLTSLLRNMKGNNSGSLPALRLSKGVLVDSSVGLGFSPMPLISEIKAPLHKNGNKLTE